MKRIDMDEAIRLVREGTEITHGDRMILAEKRLRELVDYARANSPYLADKYRDLPDDYSLADIPVTEKSEITENYDDYVTDRKISLPDVEAYCNRDTKDGHLYLDSYTVLHTSGTTGKPLYMVRDEHRNRIHGQLLGQRLLRGLSPELLDHRKNKIAAVIYAAHGSSSYEGFLRMQAAFPGYEDRIIAVNVLEDTETIVRMLNDFQPDVMTGYASVLVLLALEKEKGNLDINVKAIFNSAEALTRENHILIEKAFGCPVKNNYCMTEGGEIAMTWDSPDMLLNEDFIIIEPVDENRKPVTDPDTWSQGILVTDLTNFVQPIIRYYVGDSVKMEQIPDSEMRLPKFRINGRVNDIFELCGKPFSTSGIDSIAELLPGIVDFQFVQTADDELQVRAFTSIDDNREELLAGFADVIGNYFKEHGVSSARVTYSNEYPIKKERGGKTPRYADLRGK